MKWKFVRFLAGTLIAAQGFCGCFDGCFRSDLLAMEEPMEISPMPEEYETCDEVSIGALVIEDGSV